MHIIGAGLSGLIAGAILRDRLSGIHEAQASLPNNHNSLLRFRSQSVADALGIEFKQVEAYKATAPWQNPIADALAYSAKTNGSLTMRSITTADMRPASRFIAPSDLIPRLGNMLASRPAFGTHVDLDYIRELREDAPIISTIPMPALMDILGWEDKPEFRSVSGMTIVGKVPDCEAYCTLYIPNPDKPFNRISITGDTLHIECGEASLKEARSMPNEAERLRYTNGIVTDALDIIGILGREVQYEAHEQKYAKILPITEDARREFVMWASVEHGVYSLGRFATWRPRLLLDEVPSDLRTIERLIEKRSAYYSHTLKG